MLIILIKFIIYLLIGVAIDVYYVDKYNSKTTLLQALCIIIFYPVLLVILLFYVSYLWIIALRKDIRKHNYKLINSRGQKKNRFKNL